MTKSAHALEIAPDLVDELGEGSATPATALKVQPIEGEIKRGDTVTGLEPGATHAIAATTDPKAGIKHLRAINSAALRIWSTKAPKDVGGVISAVFLQDTAKIVYLHQWPNGKFSVYEKVA